MPTPTKPRIRGLIALTACLAWGALSCGAAITNLALKKTATASSTESSSNPASAAVDGDMTTRWSSSFQDDNWITVDLGANYMFSQVELDWEAAYGKAYKIQTSTDNQKWTDIYVINSYSSTPGQGGNEVININGTGRYVRMQGLTRATSYGYSLYEFKVMGEPTPGPNITTQPASQTLKEGQTATFNASATGSGAGTLTYQWYRALVSDSSYQAIAGATAATYTTPALNQLTDDGSEFYVRVTDSATKIYTDSAIATLTVKGLGPDITTQPSSINIAPGATATLTVAASGTGSLSFQWHSAAPGSSSFNPISGATGAVYTTPALTQASSGTKYRVVVKDNGTGYSTTSATATISVNDADARAAAIVAKMTLDEKRHLIHGDNGNLDSLPGGCVGYISGIPRLGIPNMYFADGPIGVRRNGHGSTAQPCGMTLAATWNTALAYQSGTVLGKDIRAHGFTHSLCGGVNLVARELRCGRAFEYKGEDPILAGRMNAAQVQGVQDQKVVACTKHFVLNGQETNRGEVNMVLDERSMRETDLLPFEITVKDSSVQSIMTAYNKVNGTWCAESSHLLNDILKNEWGFKGLVMSDWWGTHGGVNSANAGLDMEMPDLSNFRDPIPENRLNNMVHRILRAMIASGNFDDPGQPGTVDAANNLPMAQKVAEEGVVLLKNANNQLPLKPATLKSIAVIGPNADKYTISGGGSAIVLPVGGGELNEGGSAPVGWAQIIWYPSSPLETIKAKVGSSTTVQFDNGSDANRAASLAKSCDVAIIIAPQWTTEAADLPSLDLVDTRRGGDLLHVQNLISTVAAQKQQTIVVLEQNSAAEMPWLNNVNAVLSAWYPGQKGAEAIANILFGQVNPSGKLPITFPKSINDQPSKNIDGGTMDYTSIGLKIGYKHYDANNIEPLFPFGHGLSYTTFSMKNATKSVAGDVVSVDFDLANTGTVDGAEVAQVYISMPASINEPPRRLVGWKKETVAAGATKRVTIAIDTNSSAHPFSYYDVNSKSWKIAPGNYEIFLGNSSRSLTSIGTVSYPWVTSGIRLSKTNISFPSTGGTDTATLTATPSTLAWTITNVPSWLTAVPNSGTGNATITFTAAANGATQRSASLSAQCSVNTIPVNVAQDGTPNTPPTIAPIPNQTIKSGSVTVPVVVSDKETAAASLLVTASSDNQTLLPGSGLVHGGSGSNRTLAITPIANQYGIANVTVTVNDGGQSSSTSFMVTVPNPHPMKDENKDGISDIWAAMYPNVGAPNVSYLGDGMTNLQKALAGLDPTNPASRFFSSITVDANKNTIVAWPSVLGKYYFIQASTDLVKWTDLAPEYTGNNSVLTATVRSASDQAASRSFWRVVVFDKDSDGDGYNDWEELHMSQQATITATAGSNGTIDPAGVKTVNAGDNVHYAITAAANYQIDQVKVDGAAVGAVASYTFTNIAAGSHTIEATFSQPNGIVGKAYYLKNRADNAYMYQDGTQVKCNGSKDNDSYKWIITDMGGSPGANRKTVQIKNAVSGKFISTTSSGGAATCVDTASSWDQEDMQDKGSGPGGFYRFSSSAGFLHNENSGGIVKLGSYGSWWPGEWDIIEAPGGVNQLSVSKTSLSFTNAGGSDSITVSSNVAWTVANVPAWVTVTPMTGSNNGSISVQASANSGADRSGSFTVSGGGLTVSVSVAQGSGSASISVSKTTASFPSAGGSDTIAVTSTISWTVSGAPSWLTVTPATGTNNGTLTLQAAVNTSTTDRSGSFNVGNATSSVTVNVTQSGVGGTLVNLALNKPATSSGDESSTYAPSKAVDGDMTTRWSSLASDSAWLMVDLGATYKFSKVNLYWEAAYAKSYKIQVSSDGKTFTDVATETAGNGGTDNLSVNAVGRYVKMQVVSRATAWGNSLWEFEVMGDPNNIGPNLTTQPASVTAREGQTATFTVVATSKTGPLTYQWYRQSAGVESFTAISGATSAGYTTPVLSQANDNGANYYVRVSDATSNITVDSAIAKLTVKGLGPDITTQPASAGVMPGQKATFTVVADAMNPIAYQWYRAEPKSTTFNAINGATAATYVTGVLAVATDNGASYRVVVKDTVNNYTTTSNIATLSVTSDIDIFNEIKIGWNLGNQLDSVTDGKGGETLWGNPVITQSMIDGIYKAGFNTIRICVTWYPFTGPAPEYKIDPAYLARVKEVVDYCYKNRMIVDLNTMHEDDWLYIKMDGLEERKAKFSAMWKQIAEYFKDYDQYLIFEGMNEPVLKGGPNQYGGGTQDGWDAITILNKAFVDTVRATGGNNSVRWLMVTTYGANANTGADHMTPPPGKNIMVSIHTYTPWAFCAAWGDDYKVWDGSMNNLLDKDIQDVKRNFIDKGYHVIFTEFGAQFKEFGSGSNEAEIAKWAGYIVKNGKANGVKCMIWDNGGTGIGTNQMGMFDRRNNMTCVRPILLNSLITNAQ